METPELLYTGTSCLVFSVSIGTNASLVIYKDVVTRGPVEPLLTLNASRTEEWKVVQIDVNLVSGNRVSNA